MKTLSSKIGAGLIVTLIIGGIIFYCCDVFMGESMSLECSVTGKYYVPQKTTFTVDSEGIPHTDTDPEEFHVTVSEIHEPRGHDIKTSRHNFNTLTNNQLVRVSAKLGRWTGIVHVLGIE